MPSPRLRAALVALVASLPVLAGPPAPTAAPSPHTEYRLTMDVVQKLAAASAELRRMEAADRNMAEKFRPKSDETADAAAKRLEATPEVAKVLKANGLTGKDYVYGPLALRDAMTFVSLEKSGKKLTPTKGVPAENVEFVKAHEKEIDALGLFAKAPAPKPKKGGPKA